MHSLPCPPAGSGGHPAPAVQQLTLPTTGDLVRPPCSVPFVRPSRQCLRVDAQAAATSAERFIAHGKVDTQHGANNGSGPSFHDIEAWYSVGTRAVHSGERAGRPRVSGEARRWRWEHWGVGWGGSLALTGHTPCCRGCYKPGEAAE